MPRPKKPTEKSRPHVVSFRVTAAEQAQLEAEAASAGLTLHDCARVKALGSRRVKRLASAKAGADGGGSFELRQELRRVGVNMNQIARRLNMTGEHSPDELRDASQHLDEIFRRMLAE